MKYELDEATRSVDASANDIAAAMTEYIMYFTSYTESNFTWLPKKPRTSMLCVFVFDWMGKMNGRDILR